MIQTLEQQAKTRTIITSLLDLDHYKLTMGQFAFHRYKDVPVKYSLTNRTKEVNLAEIVGEEALRNELDSIRDLRVSEQELNYLRTLRNNGSSLFAEDYLQFLSGLQLPAYSLKTKNGQFQLEFPGKWSEAIYWETLALSAVNELYYRTQVGNSKLDEVYETGKNNLASKISMLEKNPDIRFIEFGTRRRFSKDWQDYVVARLHANVPTQMTGTSNVALAMRYRLSPKGTMAHETFMIMSGIMHENDESIRASHNQVLKEWWDEYGEDLSIALTDTYGSDFFFKDMSLEQARNWSGLRQDSGNPILFGRKQLAFYSANGIDARKKLLVPSDGLSPEAIIAIQNEFRGRINPVYGWGTNLTNDLGLKSLSLVVKATESNGYGTVKLSDNPAKAIGNKEDIARFMKIFEYQPGTYERCRY